MINSTSIIEIKTKNIIHNYKTLSKLAKNSITAAVIKANSYGLGDLEVFNLLFKNGCNHFFLATTEEAIKIRKINKKAKLYVLNGFENNKIETYFKNKLIPILNSIEEIDKYINSSFSKTNLKIGIHVETGLNRLGVNLKDLKSKKIKKIDLEILISHFASADEIKNKYSNVQNQKFKKYINLFKSIKYKSLSNSAGIINNDQFQYDMIRPGISLYGTHDNYSLNQKIKLKPVIKLKGMILQIKAIEKNQYVGYNKTYKTKSIIKVAVVGIGYADGISRIISNKGFVYFKEEKFKIIGRISMDSMTINITKSKYNLKVGNYMEIINEKNDIQKIAEMFDTIPHEVLTSISKRVQRKYI